MKNTLWRISIVLLLLLTALIVLLGLYLGSPSFKDKVDGLLNKDSEQPVSSETGVLSDPAAGSQSFPQNGSGIIATVPDGQTPGTDPYGSSNMPSINGNFPTPNIDPAYLSNELNTGYDAPDPSAISVSAEVAGRTGGEGDLSADVSTLDDATADRLEKELSEGNTGEGLEFDPMMYPYYQMIDDASKALYRQIFANAQDLFDDFKAVRSDVTPGQLRNAFTAVFNDHPELFYLDTKYSAGLRNNGTCLEIKLYFNNLADNLNANKSVFEDAAQSLAGSGGSPYDLEKTVHAALSDRNVYSLSAPYNQSAYSALNNGSTVCAGYSRAFQYVCQLAGIPCYYCSGYAGENHAWNIICLDGDFYNVDVTWDDTDSTPSYNYDWFNKTDDDYGTTHVRRDLSVYLPPCNGTRYRDLESDPEGTPDNLAPVGEQQSPDLRSLADYGLSEEDVIRDIQAYYDKALDMIGQLGMGMNSVDIPVDNEALSDQIRNAFDTNTVENSLLQPILNATGARQVDVSVTPEDLTDGRVLLHHSVTLR